MTGLFRNIASRGAPALAAALVFVAADASPAGAADWRTYWDIAWSFINFGIVVYILHKVLKDPVVNFVSKKKGEAAERIEDAEETARRAREELAATEDKTARLDEELKRLTELLEERGAAERDRIVADAKDRARQIVERAELDVQRRLREAKARVKEEVVETALAQAEEKLREIITPGDQEELIKSWLEELSHLDT